MVGAEAPSNAECELLLRQLGTLRSDQLRGFLREKKVRGLGERKADTLDRISRALRDGEIAWADVIDLLDEVEPRGKQHVVVYGYEGEEAASWLDPEQAETMTEAAGLGDLWQRRRPIAAPQEMQLSSISFNEDILEMYAVSRRSFLRRRQDLDARAFEGDPTLEAAVWERVYVRSWAKLRLTQEYATLHVSQLPRKADYDAARDAFLQLIAPWFPIGSLRTIDLSRAVGRLHEAYEAGHREVLLQAIEYQSTRGIRSSLSSAHAGQSALGETADLDEAARRMRSSGPGSGGNFYFHPTSTNPIAQPVHLTIVVKENRINFRRPTAPGEIAYILDRLRVLAT